MSVTTIHNSIPASPRTPTRDPLKAACEEMESLFLAQVLREMRASIPDDGLLPRSEGEKVFQEMLDSEYARQMARTQTTRLAELMYRQLQPTVAPTVTP